MLRVTNTGRSAAKDVLIEIKRIENNGDRNELELDDLFGKEIELNSHARLACYTMNKTGVSSGSFS